MRVDVQCDTDIRVTHDVLQGLRAHAALCHVGTEGVAAYMGCDLWKLNLINAIILVQDMLEIMLPVEGDHRHPVLVQKEKTDIEKSISYRSSIYYFNFRKLPFSYGRITQL